MRGERGSDTDTAGLPSIAEESSGGPSILVVGDGLVAAATTGFLDQVGLNPVLATPTADGYTTDVRVLWEPGLALLERIGLRRPIERLGTRIDGLRCLTTETRWTASDDATAPLLAIQSDRLQSLVGRRVRRRLTGTEQVVTAIEPTASGVQATFEGTTTELFDAAITTTRSCLPGHGRVLTAQTVDTWEFTCTDDGIQQHMLTEAWARERAAFSVPVPDGRSIRLVSVPDTAPNAALAADMLAEQFDTLTPGTPFDNLDHHDLHYRRIPCAVPRRLVSDGIVLVGADARFSIPGDCVGTTLGIEDGWVVADALAYGPPDCESALVEYVRRRRRRESEIIGSVRDRLVPVDGSADCTPVLRHLSGRRRLALGPILDQSSPSVAKSVPKDL